MILLELAAKRVAPCIKGVLIHEMSERGMSQHQIAKLLGMSQPLVHKYLKRPKSYYRERLLRYGAKQDELEYVVGILAKYLESGDRLRFLLLSTHFANEIAMRLACRAHTWLREHCARGKIVDPALEEYAAFVRRLVGRAGIAELVPQVGMNVAYAPSEPFGPGDVIALTGRIVRLDGSAAYVGEPMYGASRHLSRVLLICSKYNKSKRVAMNIARREWAVESLVKAGLRVVETGPHDSEEAFWESLERAAQSRPDVIADMGGRGLEPNVYLLASNFVELDSFLDVVLRHRRP